MTGWPPEGGRVVGIAVAAPGEVELVDADAVPSARGGRVRVEQDPALGADEVAGATVCTLISPGTELAGAYRPVGPHAPYPWIPGYAAVFRVDALGSQVEGIAVGDLVFSQGSHRSRQREAASAVWRLPDGLDPFTAVFARLMAVPLAALSTAEGLVGAEVGVSGLGPIGHLAAAIAAHSGARVTAWDPREDRRTQAPASVTVLEGPPEPGPRAQYGTTHGFDLVLECSGHDGAALAAVRAVRSGERSCWSAPPGPAGLRPRLTTCSPRCSTAT
ncbi:hypothetical protein [Naasia aerilata]|uniref:Uncharacterized protein n=1 Tax=Naasia aerilata TaxID=1162966 RepID=A0ABN6XP60_9MICO|nr:hypothetical protein [Naasia aerilata]BDZ46789.1 hypothetical protein GCM10025866_26980 [Naasia aerilata]